eukprot:366535-Chlamydomonas_euryale.AAC.8
MRCKRRGMSSPLPNTRVIRTLCLQDGHVGSGPCNPDSLTLRRAERRGAHRSHGTVPALWRSVGSTRELAEWVFPARLNSRDSGNKGLGARKPANCLDRQRLWNTGMGEKNTNCRAIHGCRPAKRYRCSGTTVCRPATPKI